MADTTAPHVAAPSAPEIPAPAGPQESVPDSENHRIEKKKNLATDTRRRLQVQMDMDVLAELRSAYNQVAQRGETLSDFVAGIITERIRQYRDEVNGGRPFGGAGTVTRGRPASADPKTQASCAPFA
ncbi:hypothetical protein ACH9DO_06880 [Kocuria sp. M1N1S27]|uniref:hypothetical protein n=1 Tax=Kocuria kalidii TaxID=3376283 RepID=UPI00378DA4D1